jgi:23S rRNA pseudouridine1911/1915/1917 synthase
LTDKTQKEGARPSPRGSGPQTVPIPERLAGKRLDAALAALYPQYSRSQLAKWVREGRALLDGTPAKPSALAKAGQAVTFDPPPAPSSRLAPAPEASVPILYEDPDVLAADKPAFLTVHPGAGAREPTLIEALLAAFPELQMMEGEGRCGMVHRLDRDTTGVILVARNPAAQEFLSRQFARRLVKKRYLAFVRGSPPKTQTIDSPLGRHPTLRHKMAAGAKEGRPALTRLRVLRRFPKTGLALVSVTLFTGRTHQARVHLASVNLPVLGDKVYGGSPKALFKAFPSLEPLVKRQLLHARRLSIPHPRRTEPLRIASPWPQDFRDLLHELEALEGLRQGAGK